MANPEAFRVARVSESLRYSLGNLMLEYAPAEEVVSFFSAEAARDEKPQTSHYFVALGLEKLGRDQQAIASLQTALAIDPAHELSQRAWGLILLRHGNLVAALEHLVEATRIHPEFGAALQDIARIAERLWPMAGSVTPRSASAPRSPTPEEYPCTWNS